MCYTFFLWKRKVVSCPSTSSWGQGQGNHVRVANNKMQKKLNEIQKRCNENKNLMSIDG